MEQQLNQARIAAAKFGNPLIGWHICGALLSPQIQGYPVE